MSLLLLPSLAIAALGVEVSRLCRQIYGNVVLVIREIMLQAGLTLALEPWFARTTDRIVFDPDGWTIRSADGSHTAHSEHTVAITEEGPLVLTSR